MKKLGSSTVGIVSTSAYDPVLEHYINRRVIFETDKVDGQRIEYVGVLKEYSTRWVSLLDCHISTENRLPLGDAELLMMHRKMDFELNLFVQEGESAALGLTLQITNCDHQNILFSHIEDGDSYQHEINRQLAPGEAMSVCLENLPQTALNNVNREDLPISLTLIAPERFKGGELTKSRRDIVNLGLPDLMLVFDTVRDVDIYIPRGRGLLRHAGGQTVVSD